MTEATALNKNCDSRFRKTENITASALTCIREKKIPDASVQARVGHNKVYTPTHEMPWWQRAVKPSQRRRIAYIRVVARRAGVIVLRGAKRSGVERNEAKRNDAVPPACALRGPVFLWKSLISRAIDSRWDRTEFATGIIYRLSIAPPNLWVRKRA